MDDLDRILSQEQEIIPSSGFAASVMDAVQTAASTPSPIPFPWKRALPGLSAAIVALAVLIVNIAFFLTRGGPQGPVRPFLPWGGMWLAWIAGAGPMALALVLSFVSVKLAMKYAAK